MIPHFLFLILLAMHAFGSSVTGRLSHLLRSDSLHPVPCYHTHPSHRPLSTNLIPFLQTPYSVCRRYNPSDFTYQTRNPRRISTRAKTNIGNYESNSLKRLHLLHTWYDLMTHCVFVSGALYKMYSRDLLHHLSYVKLEVSSEFWR